MSTPGTPYASASLYIGDLAADVTEALLFEIFNAVGPVASVRVCRDAATRRSLGYAYVNFHRVDDAERALDTMNFKQIRSRACRIMWSHRDPSLRKSGLGNIFVKNLAKTIDNKTLYDTFSMFGNILSCKVSTNSKGESLGYGFVHYESDEAAANAIAKVNGKQIAGKTVTVAPFRAKKERSNGQFTNVYVKNLPIEYDQKAFNQMCSEYGEVTSCVLMVDEEGKSKRFGFVNFGTPEIAAQAVEQMDRKELGEGNTLHACRAQKKSEREKELHDRFEALKLERQKKFMGVNLYVKNLAETIDDEKLRQEFDKFGAITSAKVMRDSADKSKGFGFVCFSTTEEATKAVNEMNGKMMDAKPLYVALAQRKEDRRQQLEAQYAQRKIGQPQMYPPQGAHMFYQGIPQRPMMYPQPMVARRWNGNPGPMMMRGQPVTQYQLMPVTSQRPPSRGGRGQRGPNQPNQRGQQPKGEQQRGRPGVRYEQNVRNQNRPQQQQNEQPQSQPQQPETTALTIKALASAPEEQRKQMIGERLYPLIQALEPTQAGKITGMLLEMDNGELLHLMESQSALKEKIREAIAVLAEHEQPE